MGDALFLRETPAVKMAPGALALVLLFGATASAVAGLGWSPKSDSAQQSFIFGVARQFKGQIDRVEKIGQMLITTALSCEHGGHEVAGPMLVTGAAHGYTAPQNVRQPATLHPSLPQSLTLCQSCPCSLTAQRAQWH